MNTSNPFVLSGPFIESAVARCVDHTAYSNTELHHACTRLVLFVSTQLFVGLTNDAVFAAPTIEQYIATLTDMTPASRGNLRSMLYRMSEVLLGTTGKGDMSYALAASSPSEPYITNDQVKAQVWEKAQSEARRVDATALLCLGFGAGLSASEITSIRPSDLVLAKDDKGGDVVVVTVAGTRPRALEVTGTWAVGLTRVLLQRTGAKWLFAPNRKGAGKNLISNFVARGPDVGLRPQTQRMRATYLVKHIREEDSVVELLRIAGVASLDALARYVRFVG